MIVEFIGSTGAGKTTLACEVQRRLAENTQAATSFDLIADLLGCRRVTNATLRNLITDLVGLPFFLSSLNKHGAFFVFALKAVSRHTRNPFLAINYLRSIVRRIGTYELSKRCTRNRIVLVDEGTVLSAHVLFVFSDTPYHLEEIQTFARLVPLPELVVFIKTPLDSLVERTLRRSDAPRETRSKDPIQVEKFVRCAAKMFDDLIDTKEFRNRVLTAANPASTDDERGVVADRIAQYILKRQPGVQRVTTPAGRIEPASY